MLSIILDTQKTMASIELTEAFLAAKQRAFSPNTRRAYRDVHVGVVTTQI
jgi:hypothetical protein